MYDTGKIHLTVPKDVYEYLRINKKFKDIDGIVTEFLIDKYNIE